MNKLNFAAANTAAKTVFTAAAALVAAPAAIIGGVTYAAYDPPPASKEVTDAAVNDLLRTAHDPAFLTMYGRKIENVGKIAITNVEQDGNTLCADYATIAFRPTLDDPFSDFNKQRANTKRTCITRLESSYPEL